MNDNIVVNDSMSDFEHVSQASEFINGKRTSVLENLMLFKIESEREASKKASEILNKNISKKIYEKIVEACKKEALQGNTAVRFSPDTWTGYSNGPSLTLIDSKDIPRDSENRSVIKSFEFLDLPLYINKRANSGIIERRRTTENGKVIYTNVEGDQIIEKKTVYQGPHKPVNKEFITKLLPMTGSDRMNSIQEYMYTNHAIWITCFEYMGNLNGGLKCTFMAIWDPEYEAVKLWKDNLSYDEALIALVPNRRLGYNITEKQVINTDEKSDKIQHDDLRTSKQLDQVIVEAKPVKEDPENNVTNDDVQDAIVVDDSTMPMPHRINQKKGFWEWVIPKK